MTEGSRHGKSENGRENVLVDTGMRVEYFAQMAIGDVKPKGSTEILLASLAEEGLKPGISTPSSTPICTTTTPATPTCSPTR